MSSVISETEYKCLKSDNLVGYAMLGQSRSMQANRISFFLDVKGIIKKLNKNEIIYY